MIGILVTVVNTISISLLQNVLYARKNIVLNIVRNVVEKDIFSFLDQGIK